MLELTPLTHVNKSPKASIKNNVQKQDSFNAPQFAAAESTSLITTMSDVAVGFGDGVWKGVTLGAGDLNSVRAALGIEGGFDASSSNYQAWNKIGKLFGAATLGGASGMAIHNGMLSKGMLRFINQNRYFRFGYGDAPKNTYVIRAAGRVVDYISGKPRSHWDVYKMKGRQ